MALGTIFWMIWVFMISFYWLIVSKMQVKPLTWTLSAKLSSRSKMWTPPLKTTSLKSTTCHTSIMSFLSGQHRLAITLQIHQDWTNNHHATRNKLKILSSYGSWRRKRQVLRRNCLALSTSQAALIHIMSTWPMILGRFMSICRAMFNVDWTIPSLSISVT